LNRTLTVLTEVIKDSDLTELFIHISSGCDTIEQLINSDDLKIELKITDGDSSFRGTLERNDITKAKHQKNTQTDREWNTLLIQSLFNEIPLNYIDTVELSGKEVVREGSAVLEIELKTKIGPSIYQSLGILEFKPLDDDSSNYADHLFEWSRLMSDYNRKLHKELIKTRAQTETLKKQIEEMNKFQKELVEESQMKDKIQLKIMTRLLNTKKKHYQQLATGEIKDDPDDFNKIAIKNIKDEIFQEDEDIKPKVKKSRKPLTKKQPRGLKAAQLFRKRNQPKEHPKVKHEDEDGDEFIPDSNDEEAIEEKKTEIKEESKPMKKEAKIKKEGTPEIPQAVKAEPEPSVHFKFSNNKDAQEDDGDETVEEKKSNDEEEIDDENITEVDETDDATEDDQEMVAEGDDFDNDAATVTDTDTDTDTQSD